MYYSFGSASSFIRIQFAFPILSLWDCSLRPWLQDFTASYLDRYKKYGAKEVRDQINAVYDSGQDEWILWNAGNIYTKGALNKE